MVEHNNVLQCIQLRNHSSKLARTRLTNRKDSMKDTLQGSQLSRKFSKV